MKNISLLFGTLSLLISASSFADCQQANLRSADGSQISIHYSSFGRTDGDTAWINPSLHVTLSGDRCANAKSVEMTLVRVPTANCGGPRNGYSETVTLSHEPGSCNYSLLSGPQVQVANHCGKPAQQAAVKVSYWDNSEWLVDPASGQHNFNYSVSTNYSQTTEVCN